jgi:hypothetical protein
MPLGGTPKGENVATSPLTPLSPDWGRREAQSLGSGGSARYFQRSGDDEKQATIFR